MWTLKQDLIFCNILRLLDTDGGQYSSEKVLSVHFKNLSPGSPEWNNVKQTVQVTMSSVQFCVHQVI